MAHRGHEHGRVPVAVHADAVRALIEAIPTGEPERVAIADLDPLQVRVLASDATSPIDLPPFDNSQMDGYAVRAADLAHPDVTHEGLTVAAPVPAGAPGAPLAPGTAAPIMTGAAIPDGADAVVPIEEAEPSVFGRPGDLVRLPAEGAEPGRFVRRRGSDLAEGGLLLVAGTSLGPAQLGVLAAAGITEVMVRQRMRVLVVSTGLELAEPGAPLTPGRIHDANSIALRTAIARAGAEVTAVRVGSDDPQAFLAAVDAHPEVDLLLTTGGVSAGAYEVVRESLEPRGVAFTSVAMQPGGPQGIGVAALDGGRALPVVAFPGNPVSALVSFELFLRRPLRERAGLHPAGRPSRTARLTEAVQSPPLHQVRRGRLAPDGTVALVGGPSSHLLHAYATADALVHLPPELTAARAGDEVEVWPIGGSDA